jgi:hypothetical protein
MSLYTISMIQSTPRVLFVTGFITATVCGLNYVTSAWQRLRAQQELERKLAKYYIPCEVKHEGENAPPLKHCIQCSTKKKVDDLSIASPKEIRSFTYFLYGGGVILSSYLLSDVFSMLNIK